MLFLDHQIHIRIKQLHVFDFLRIKYIPKKNIIKYIVLKRKSNYRKVHQHFIIITLQKHIQHVLATVNHSQISKDIITIVGFGTSGSGKTFNLLGMDSSGLHNKYSVLSGVINDLKNTRYINLTIEVTQVYKNKLFVLRPAHKIPVNQVFNTFIECLSCWKQEQFSTHNSSRAHLIIRLILNDLEIRIIDTAGFETPDEERKHVETVAINQDMLAFKECIRAVANKDAFIPSRRRTITRVLFEHKNNKDIKNHIFVIGAIDPNYDTEKMKLEFNASNPKHPKISIIHNTLNYLTMLGCASVITTRRPITSRQKRKDVLKEVQKKIESIDISINRNASKSNSNVSNEIIEQLNTIESKFNEYVPSRPIEPNQRKPLFSLNRQRRLSEPAPKNNNAVSKEISKIRDKYNELKDDTELLTSRGMMHNIINNRRNSEPLTPVGRYIQNQEILMQRMNKLNYDTDKLNVLNLINDQQLLTITMQMVILERCNVKSATNI